MGVTLAEELPFAHVVLSKYAGNVCADCMKTTWDRGIEGTLKRCARCKFAGYCNSKCQKNDWPNHKAECAYLLHVPPRAPNAIPRLIGRIITKLQRDGDKSPAFNGRFFSSLQTNASEIEKDDEKRNGFIAFAHVIRNYLVLNDMPSSDQIFQIFCKILTNALEVTDNYLNKIGLALYLGLSALDHSCSPDAVVIFSGRKAILRSLNNDITEYSNKLHIQYCDSLDSGPMRREILKKQYCFVCNCELCQDFEKDRQKYSLRCTKCSDGFCPYNPEAENTEIRCKVCGEEAEFVLDDVKRLYRRLIDRGSLGRLTYVPYVFPSPCQTRQDKTRLERQLDKLIDFYRECRIVFSPYNVPLCKLAYDITNLAAEIEKYDEAVEYAEKTMFCHRTFLPKGHPCLAVQAYEYARLLMRQGNERCAAELQKAFELVCESFGAESSLAMEIDGKIKAVNA